MVQWHKEGEINLNGFNLMVGENNSVGQWFKISFKLGRFYIYFRPRERASWIFKIGYYDV